MALRLYMIISQRAIDYAKAVIDQKSAYFGTGFLSGNLSSVANTKQLAAKSF
jgi:hypothetical protein